MSPSTMYVAADSTGHDLQHTALHYMTGQVAAASDRQPFTAYSTADQAREVAGADGQVFEVRGMGGPDGTLRSATVLALL